MSDPASFAQTSKFVYAPLPVRTPFATTSWKHVVSDATRGAMVVSVAESLDATRGAAKAIERLKELGADYVQNRMICGVEMMTAINADEARAKNAEIVLARHAKIMLAKRVERTMFVDAESWDAYADASTVGARVQTIVDLGEPAVSPGDVERTASAKRSRQDPSDALEAMTKRALRAEAYVRAMLDASIGTAKLLQANVDRTRAVLDEALADRPSPSPRKE